AEYMTGLLSRLERQTGEGIAYLLDQGRQGLQKFVGQMLDGHGALLPHAWVAGDDETDRPMSFRRALHGRSQRWWNVR
ncbi:MAG TPA: hypothetical protein VKP69_09345, partial [Isosphaeraceae bacterium]|nr:hypothetical protein [Isosphaeraceae bacterium]